VIDLSKFEVSAAARSPEPKAWNFRGRTRAGRCERGDDTGSFTSSNGRAIKKIDISPYGKRRAV